MINKYKIPIVIAVLLAIVLLVYLSAPKKQPLSQSASQSVTSTGNLKPPAVVTNSTSTPPKPVIKSPVQTPPAPPAKSPTYSTIADIYNTGVDTKCVTPASVSASVTYYISGSAIRIEEKSGATEVNILGTKQDFYEWSSGSPSVSHLTGPTAATDFGLFLNTPITIGLVCTQQSIPASVFVPPPSK